ncbi:DUF302 domain-containing protein [Streptomyces sp. NPDC093105]|uniref:DUF302 domain-containing protein n=1 Tax=Streptomyces sp. NPDC093105 TaxID=3366029 RepID=UPI003818A09F
MPDAAPHALQDGRVVPEQGVQQRVAVDGADEPAVQATLRAKLRHDLEPYLILGARPPLARRALNADRSVGLLLPCNVVVRTDGDQVIVRAIAPSTMAVLTGVEAHAAGPRAGSSSSCPAMSSAHASTAAQSRWSP